MSSNSERQDWPRILDAMLADATVLQGRAEWGNAQHVLEIAEQVAARNQLAAYLARVRSALAYIYFAQNDFVRAGQTYLLAAQADDPAERAFCLLQAGRMLLLQLRLAEAQDYTTRALAYYDSQEDLRMRGFAHSALADILQKQGERGGAQRELDRARVCYRQAGETWGEMQVLQQAGRYAIEANEFEAALSADQEALALADQLGHSRTRAQIHLSLATIFGRLRLPGEASQEYRAAAEYYRANADPAGEARACIALADLTPGDDWRNLIARALLTARRAHDPYVLIQTHRAAALHHAQSPLRERAHLHLRRERALARQVRMPELIAQAWMDRATVMSAQGNLEQARTACLRGARWYRCIAQIDGQSTALLEAARLDLEAQRDKQAEPLLRRVLAVTAGEPNQVYNRMTADIGMWVIADRRGDRAAAIDWNLAALKEQETLRADFAVPALGVRLLGSRAGLYASAIRCLTERGETVRAWEWMERARSRAFLSLLGTTRAIDEQAPGGEREQELLRQLRAIQSGAQTTHPDAGQIAQLRALSDELDSIWERQGQTEYVALRRGHPLSFPETVRLLKTDSTL